MVVESKTREGRSLPREGAVKGGLKFSYRGDLKGRGLAGRLLDEKRARRVGIAEERRARGKTRFRGLNGPACGCRDGDVKKGECARAAGRGKNLR